MSKDKKYFTYLWERNSIGHFRRLGDLAKKGPWGILATVAIAIPVLVVSPFSSFIKTFIDYHSRKSLPEISSKLERADFISRIDLLDTNALISLVQNDLLAYKKRFVFSTMSKSTQHILALMQPLKEHKEEVERIAEAESIRQQFKLYMADPKNRDKRFYNLLGTKIVEISDKLIQDGNMVLTANPARRLPTVPKQASSACEQELRRERTGAFLYP